jgi:hypothetical protein
VPAAVILQIADAVVAALNGATLSQTFLAERAYVPVHELRDLVTLRVSVVPTGLSLQLLNRSPRHLIDYVVDIGVQKHIDGDALTTAEVLAECDPLMLLAEEIGDLFRGKSLAIAAGAAVCVEIANRPVFAPAHLDEKRVFTSVVSLTFRLGR